MDAGRHPLIEVISNAEVVGCEGSPGDFRVRVRKNPRYVREDVCVACGRCVDVCPVDCIHPRKDEDGFDSAEMLYIDPEECIDCGACVPECPVEAIFPEDEVPERWQHYVDINRNRFVKA